MKDLTKPFYGCTLEEAVTVLENMADEFTVDASLATLPDEMREHHTWIKFAAKAIRDNLHDPSARIVLEPMVVAGPKSKKKLLEPAEGA